MRYFIPSLLSLLLLGCAAKKPAVRAPNQPLTIQDKYLGNIITGHIKKGLNPDPIFTTYFDQVSPENVGKHGQVEVERDVYTWSFLDTVYQFAQEEDLLFKHHAFIFDHQDYSLRPWLRNLSPEETKAEYEEWIKDYFARYPETDMVDVVNEALQSVVEPNIRAGLGGDEGFAWIRWMYAKAREHAPEGCELLINEYSVLNQPERLPQYRAIIEAVLADGNLDGIGLQGHALEKVSTSDLKTRLDYFAELGLPLHISEYDVNAEDDEQQRKILSEQFPVFWNHPAVAGVTFWGYKEGETWLPATAMIDADGKGRPSWEWLMGYLEKE